MSLRVIHPGTFSLPVDAGRSGHRAWGIPLGGPSDAAAFRIGNALVGNPPDTPALEMSHSGPTLFAEADIHAVVFGSPFHIAIDGVAIPESSSFAVRQGQTLRIGSAITGVTAYLCVAGGFTFPRILGSVSGFAPITADEVLRCCSSQRRGRGLVACDVRQVIEDNSPSELLHVLPGPQADWFNLETFAEAAFRVTPASNRMGIRLEGPPLIRPPRELISEAVAPGAIQVTNEGQCIILGVDGQTIGGYPKIAHIISADLDRLAHLQRKSRIRFESVSEAEAERLAHAYRTAVDGLIRRLQWMDEG